MSIQLVDYTVGKARRKSESAEPEIYLSPIFRVEELLFHVQQSDAVTLFLWADCHFYGQPAEEDYLSIRYLDAVVNDLEQGALFSSPLNRVGPVEGSFSVQFTENIYIQNASCEQRIVSAWANIQTPLVPPLGSRLTIRQGGASL